MRTTIEAAAQADITDPVVVIRIQRAYRPDLSAQALYEVTRGVWVMGPRRTKARYALAIFDRIVREVYEIDAWHPAGTTPYETRPLPHVQREGRWEFTGQVAPVAIRERYLGKSVSGLWKQGASNPITYLNC